MARSNLVPDPQFGYGAARNWQHVRQTTPTTQYHNVSGVWYPEVSELSEPCGSAEDWTKCIWETWMDVDDADRPADIAIVTSPAIGLPANCDHALQWTLNQSGPSVSLLNDIQVPQFTSCASEGLIEVQPSTTYSVSLYLGVDDIPGSGSDDIFWLCVWVISGPDDHDESGHPLDANPCYQAIRAADLTANAWTRVDVALTTPPWGGYLEVNLYDDEASYSIGNHVWVTGIMVEPVSLESASWHSFTETDYSIAYDNGGGYELISEIGVTPRVWDWTGSGWAGDTQSIVPGSYGDGDTAAWHWYGTEHRSISIEGESFDWPARYPTQVIGGNGVDTLDATWEIDRKGGFVGASLDIVPPIGISRHDVSLMAPVEIRDTNGHLLWEGRVEEPGVIDRDTNTQAVECTGYVSILEDNQALICNYIDTEFAHWNTTQCTRFASRFDVQTVDDNDVPKLVMKAVQGIEIPTGANARAYWFPTNTYNGAMARYMTFRITAEGISGFRIALYSSTAPGAEKTLIWSRTTDCSALDVTLDEEDIPATTACLTFRIEHTADDMTYLAYGTGDPETWGLYYGAEISRIKVYGSELGNTVSPEAVVGHLADAVTDDDHRDFPDASGLTIGQLAYFEPTTPRAVLEDVNDALDWNYGMSDGQVFYFRKPWTPATVPVGEIVVVSQKDPGLVDWNVRLDWKDVCNQVVAYYTKSNGRWGNLMVWDYEGPIEGPTPARTRFLDLRGICDTSTEATTMAQRVLDDCLWPKPTGTVTLKGLCTLGNGYRMPAIYLRPGMMLKCPELRLEDTGNPAGKGLMLITAVSGRLVDRQITLTLGTRAATLDRILAREQLKLRTRKRKGA